MTKRNKNMKRKHYTRLLILYYGVEETENKPPTSCTHIPNVRGSHCGVCQRTDRQLQQAEPILLQRSSPEGFVWLALSFNNRMEAFLFPVGTGGGPLLNFNVYLITKDPFWFAFYKAVANKTALLASSPPPPVSGNCRSQKALKRNNAILCTSLAGFGVA